jgi:hypothetical protein
VIFTQNRVAQSQTLLFSRTVAIVLQTLDECRGTITDTYQSDVYLWQIYYTFLASPYFAAFLLTAWFEQA